MLSSRELMLSSCWRRLLRVPWTARRSNQSILKEISPVPWTSAYQAPPSMGFSRQEYWSGLPLPSPTHGLYSPWNSPGQNTEVGSLSLLQGIFPTLGSNPGFPHCRWILYQLSHKGSPGILSGEPIGEPIPSPADLPDPEIRPGSPALQADSLPTELSGKAGK